MKLDKSPKNALKLDTHNARTFKYKMLYIFRKKNLPMSFDFLS
jgi:hypothetical protein